jgi:hypothetical protein
MEQLTLLNLPRIPINPRHKKLLKRSGERPYTLRFTVDQGKKFVGKRISMTLHTKDLSFAARCTGMIYEALEKADFILTDKKFGRPQDDFNNMALHDNINAIIIDLRGDDDEMADTLQDAVDNSK